MINTGYSDVLDETGMKSQGVKTILVKPVSTKELAETVTALLAQSN